MAKVARIEKILVYISLYPSENIPSSKFKVETRLSAEDAWEVCKGEHSLNDPHMIQCDQNTVAKYIRLSCKVSLILREVSVLGKPMEGK